MTIETIEYGEVDNATLLTIFGDEMTYNELKFYAKNKDVTTHLKVEWNRNDLTQLVRVWFDAQLVMDKKYRLNHSCDMFYHLSQLDPQEDSEDEDEDEDAPECSAKHCDCTEGLILAMGWNRYYTDKNDMITSQLFCKDCIDEYTKNPCKGCSNMTLYSEMQFKTGGAFEDESYYEWQNYFCKECIADIDSRDYNPSEYI